MWTRGLVLGALLVSACEDAPSDGLLNATGPKRGQADSTSGSGGAGGGGGSSGADAGPVTNGGAGAQAAGIRDSDGGVGGGPTDSATELPAGPDSADVPSVADAIDALPVVISCAGGTDDLSNLGAGNFIMSFHIVTTQRGWVALVNQRPTCSYGAFWDIRQSATGTIVVEIDGNDQASYETVESTRAINDGKPHDVVVARLASKLGIRIDGIAAAMGVSWSPLGALPSLRLGSDVCGATDTPPTLPFAGTTLSGLCIRRG